MALVCCGVAVLSANVSAALPAGWLAGLHVSRADGGTMAQLRSQVSDLADEAARMRRENNVLLQRFTLAEQARNEVTRRVGSLEVSLPTLLDARSASAGTGIDRSMTSSIDESPTHTFPAEGGTVAVQQKPLLPRTAPTAAPTEPVTPPPDVDAFGIALGFPVAAAEAEGQWQELSARVGTLLLGLAPLLQESAGAGTRLVAGPVDTVTQADALCGRLDLVGIPCQPVRFTGEPLPLLN